ncbi:MAG: hypothetical protein WDW36_004649 [Sanguina aurantia]
MPGCYDALSAKMLAKAGHKSAFVSGYAVSASLLGEPDLGLLTPPEMARKASQISASIPSIPVIVDADTGGGNVLNVQRTVRQLIAAGCKGCFLEDQQWPKRMGHMRNKEIIGMDDFAAKVYAARDAIGDSDFFLVARTDARGTSAKYGLEDAITRANLYMDAGADASFVEAPRSDEELAQIGAQTKGPRVCNMLEGGVTPLHTPEELRAMGFHLVVYPLAGLYSATRARCWTRTGPSPARAPRGGDLSKLAHFSEFNELIGLEARIAKEEALTKGPASGAKLHVKVRATLKPIA